MIVFAEDVAHITTIEQVKKLYDFTGGYILSGGYTLIIKDGDKYFHPLEQGANGVIKGDNIIIRKDRFSYPGQLEDMKEATR
ncbi:MAG: hypothetical protein GY941_22425 [Planctomycetes bacterium]|nr:hypothetical protein [Planctomycetota bacterium]